MKKSMMTYGSRVLLTALAFGTVFTLSNCKKEEPTADFTYAVDGFDVDFTYTGENGESFSWSFGDGETSTLENPSHTYSEGGDFTVTLNVTNDDGEDSKSQTVTIEVASGEAGSPELNFGDADGAMYSINTVTVQSSGGFDVEIKIGTSVAWFADEDGTEFVDVGDVSFQQGSLSGTLDKQTNNSYNWLEDGFSTEGFDKDGLVEYSIEGGNGHPQFTGLANGYPFPTVKKVAESGDAISGSASYTLAHDGSINNVDSTIFSIYGPDNSISQTVGPTVTSVTFSASEMSSLGSGYAILQIASFNIVSNTLGGKKYYNVNETVASKTVTVE